MRQRKIFRSLLGILALIPMSGCLMEEEPLVAEEQGYWIAMDDAYPPRPKLDPGEGNEINKAETAAITPASGLTTQDLGSLSVKQVVEVLIGSGPNAPEFKNVSFSGDKKAAGTFLGPKGILKLEQGIVLSSGSISSITGPNLQDGTTTNHGNPGDSSLNNLLPSGQSTRDAAVLEFDFRCEGQDAASFLYVFSSEEYNEFVNSGYNDVFGFFINGATPSKNIARLPDGSPVAINNVNLGKNSALYRNNDLQDGGGSINTEMDGLTTVLTAVAHLNPGWNHLRLAIADTNDHVLDSNVFLKAGSLLCGDPGPQCGDGVVEAPEECDDGNLADGDGCSAACTIENRRPVAVCQSKSACNAAGQCYASVTGLGAGSYDPDGDSISITQSPDGPYSVGQHQVLISVSDNELDDQCTASVTVEDCETPDIDCAPDFSIECTANGAANVTPPSASATDNCNDAAVDGPPAGSYPLGTHALSYAASDLAGNTAICATMVTVEDTIAPSVACPAPSVVECTGDAQAAVDPGQAQASDTCTSATVNVPGTNSYPLGTTDVQYTAVDQSGNEASCATSVTVQDTTPPSITCPAPTVAECTGNAQAVVDPGTAQVAEICTSATVNVPGPGSYPLGNTEVAYTAVDQAGNPASCATSVTVQDTTPPTIECPAPVVVECTGDSSADVTPGEATAADICTGAGIAGPSAGSYPLGTTEVTYTATDFSGNQAICTSIIEVVDTTPAELEVHPPQPMWPPNHKYVTLDLLDECGVVVKDQCGGILDPSITSPTITCVTSDEPENAHGDGNTTDDIVIVDDTTVKLRAERQGDRDGRVYNIHFQVQDASGNVSQGMCPVKVPHDRRPSIQIVDSGVAYQVCR